MASILFLGSQLLAGISTTWIRCPHCNLARKNYHTNNVESSLFVAQIDFSQPISSTEEEGNRNEGNEEAFPSHQAAIAVTEGEEIEPENVKDA